MDRYFCYTSANSKTLRNVSSVFPPAGQTTRTDLLVNSSGRVKINNSQDKECLYIHKKLLSVTVTQMDLF